MSDFESTTVTKEEFELYLSQTKHIAKTLDGVITYYNDTGTIATHDTDTNCLRIRNPQLGVSDTPIYTQGPKIQSNVFFFNNGSTTGKIFINQDGLLDFEGNATESALVFIEELKKMWR